LLFVETRARFARRRLLQAASFAALATLAADGAAYCRTSTGCDPVHHQAGKVCDPPEPDDCGVPIAWAVPCVGFGVQRDASKLRGISYDEADAALQQSFSTWMNALCDGGPPSLSMEDLGQVDCSKIEFNTLAANASALIFRDDAWPHEDLPNAIALTTVSFDPDTGELRDADIEVAGICAVYAPGRATRGRCDYLPEHGYSPKCAGDQTELRCSTAAPGAASPGSFATFLGLVLVFSRRRRKAR
jgi:MYXO-CTERM domain-containing protein